MELKRRHGKTGKGKRKEHCDLDGLLRSRTAGGHDDCTNVSFFVGIPNSQRCCISIFVLSSIAGELLHMFELQCESPLTTCERIDSFWEHDWAHCPDHEAFSSGPVNDHFHSHFHKR